MHSIAGTLVTVIPCRGGVVVSADSLVTVGGEIIPGRQKLKFLPNRADTVFTVTGVGEFISTPMRGVSMKQWIETIAPRFSAQEATKHLLARHTRVDRNVIHEVAEGLRSSFETYFSEDPVQRLCFQGREIARAVIVHVEPADASVLISTILIEGNPDGTVRTTNIDFEKANQETERIIKSFGESSYLENNILRPDSPGVAFLPPELPDLWNTPRFVKEMDPTNAAAICRALVHATEKTSSIIPIATAVGGEPTIYFLDGKSPPQPMSRHEWSGSLSSASLLR